MNTRINNFVTLKIDCVKAFMPYLICYVQRTAIYIFMYTKERCEKDGKMNTNDEPEFFQDKKTNLCVESSKSEKLKSLRKKLRHGFICRTTGRVHSISVCGDRNKKISFANKS